MMAESYVAWPVMEASSWLVADLEDVFLDTTYVLPAQPAPATDLRTREGEGARKSRESDSRYVLWVDKDLYADMHPLPHNRPRERRDRAPNA
jgi:hypothetical protein